MDDYFSCPCGHAFGEPLGKYGCPSCGGDQGPAVSTLRQIEALETAVRDDIEASELQGWLMKHAGSLRPTNGGGLMAWALVVLQKRAAPPGFNIEVERTEFETMAKGKFSDALAAGRNPAGQYMHSGLRKRFDGWLDCAKRRSEK